MQRATLSAIVTLIHCNTEYLSTFTGSNEGLQYCTGVVGWHQQNQVYSHPCNRKGEDTRPWRRERPLRSIVGPMQKFARSKLAERSGSAMIYTCRAFSITPLTGSGIDPVHPTPALKLIPWWIRPRSPLEISACAIEHAEDLYPVATDAWLSAPRSCTA